MASSSLCLSCLSLRLLRHVLWPSLMAWVILEAAMSSLHPYALLIVINLTRPWGIYFTPRVFLLCGALRRHAAALARRTCPHGLPAYATRSPTVSTTLPKYMPPLAACRTRPPHTLFCAAPRALHASRHPVLCHCPRLRRKTHRRSI